MSKSVPVDKSEFKGPIRQQKIITLPVDDPRNNPKFKRLNPHVKFEGKSKKKPTSPKEHGPVQRSRPETRANTQPNLSGTTNVPVNHPPEGMQSTTKLPMDGGQAQEVDNATETNEFLFHEVADENYSLQTENDLNGGFQNTLQRTFEGQNNNLESDSVPIPTNLSVTELTIDDAQTSSGDGNPTYLAKLNFEAGDLYDDYEIRIVKAQ